MQLIATAFHAAADLVLGAALLALSGAAAAALGWCYQSSLACFGL